MSARTLETTTDSDIFISDTGVTILDGEVYTIAPENYAKFAASIDIDPYIDSGDILVKFDGKTLDVFTAKILIHELTIVIKDLVVSGSNINALAGIQSLNLSGNLSGEYDGNGSGSLLIGGGPSKIGTVITMTFSANATVSDEYLGHPYNAISGNSTLALIPWDSSLIGISFSNTKRNADPIIRVERSTFTGGVAKDTPYEVELTNIRVFVKNDLSIPFAAGDKVAVYIEDNGGNSSDVIVDLFFKITSDTILDDTSNFLGNF